MKNGKKKVKEQDAPVDAATQGGKGGGVLLYVEPKQIQLWKDQPRKDIGDVTELLSSVRQHKKILQPLTCRRAKDGGIQLVCGTRRLYCAKEAGLKTVPVQVFDAIDDDTAMAWAVSENSGDSRTELKPLEQARVFERLQKKSDKPSFNQIGKMCGYSGQHVRKTLQLLTAPVAIQKKLGDGSISKMAALAFSELDPNVQKGIIAQVDGDTTEHEVKDLANAYIRQKMDEEGEESVGPANPKSATRPGGAGGVELSVWRSKSEIRKQIENSVIDVVESRENLAKEKKPDESRLIPILCYLAGMFFCAGMIESLDYKSKEFDRAFKRVESTLEWEPAGDEFEEVDEDDEDANP